MSWFQRIQKEKVNISRYSFQSGLRKMMRTPRQRMVIIRSPRQAGYADAHAQDGEGDRLVPPHQEQDRKKRIEEGEAQADHSGTMNFM